MSTVGARARTRSAEARQRGSAPVVARAASALALLLAVPIPAPGQVSVPAAPTASTGSSQDTARDLHQLGSLLNDPATPSALRDEAARRLVARRSTEATGILQDVYRNPGNPAAQIAIARALAQSPLPDPAFIPLLVGALGGNAKLTDAAASALVNYRDNPTIFQQLRGRADDQLLPNPSRVAIVRAMGGIIEQPVADFLVRTLLNPNESADVQNAAADALGNMTGLGEENGRDRQRWQTWWQLNGGKADDRFRADVLGNQLRQFAQTRLHYNQLVNSLQAIVGQDYAQLQSPADRVAALKRYLSPDGPTPELRVAGAALVSSDFESGRPVPEEVRQALRVLIGDADADVRRAVIATLGTINDRLAAPALITQLVQETDPQIKKQIAVALGNINDLSAVPALLSMVDDPLFDVGASAASALQGLGPELRQDNPALARKTADTLRRVLSEPRARDPNATELRVACTAALAALKDPRLADLFRSLTAPSEDDRVRAAALEGLGDLNDPNAIAVITGNLDDPDAAVRLAAARALETVAGFAQAEQLFGMLNPTNEPDAHVRDQAWTDLQKVLSGGTKEQLNGWPDRFKDNPDRRLFAQQAIASALQLELQPTPGQPPAPDLQASDEQSLATQRQDIGETLMSLRRPDEAADQFRQAMDYWSDKGRTQPGSDATLDGLVADMENALLKTGNYDQAIAFAGKQLSVNPAYQRIVGPSIKNEASRLKGAGDNASALKLVAAALKMTPPLDQRYQADLQETATQAGGGGAGG